MDFRGADMQAVEAKDRLAAKDAEILKLRNALNFCGNIAEEELAYATVGTGAEVALRHIARKRHETLY